MNDINSAFNDSITPILDYGSDSSKPLATADAMDASNTFTGNRNPFNPDLVVTDTLDSGSWLADPQKVRSLLSFFG
jgi:hypothetical protein